MKKEQNINWFHFNMESTDHKMFEVILIKIHVYIKSF